MRRENDRTTGGTTMNGGATVPDQRIPAKEMAARRDGHGINSWDQGGLVLAGGWVLVASAAAAFYVAGAMMLAESFGRTILPLGKFSKSANVPGRAPTRPIGYPAGVPGSKVGQ